jgi:excisionase family DNA binding protein
MSVYDSKDLMSYKAAAREFGVAETTLQMAIANGSLRAIEQDGSHWLLRQDIEQFVKRTVKRGAGNRVVTRIYR